MTFCHHTSYCVVDNSVDNLLITSLIIHMGHFVSLGFSIFSICIIILHKKKTDTHIGVGS